MTTQSGPENTPVRAKTLADLQEQFRDLCALGMRGAAAIAGFGDNPAEKLQVVKESTATMNDGLAELKQDLERAKITLLSGERIFRWEYDVLEKIAVNAGFSFEEIQERITVQNGSIVTLDLDYTAIADLGHVSHLTALKELRLVDTPITDISPLASLTALRWLLLPALEDPTSQKIIGELESNGVAVFCGQCQ